MHPIGPHKSGPRRCLYHNLTAAKGMPTFTGTAMNRQRRWRREKTRIRGPLPTRNTRRVGLASPPRPQPRAGEMHGPWQVNSRGKELEEVGISPPTCYTASCIFCSCQRMSCRHHSSITLQRKSKQTSVRGAGSKDTAPHASEGTLKGCQAPLG